MRLITAILSFFITNVILASTADFLPFPAKDVVRHTYYTLSYNEKYEQANWVYYTLTDSMVLHSGEERGNNFRSDKLVVTASAKSSDYTNSGYDRGHLCPAADMGFNKVAMEESFYMSNISPQVPDFNRGIWKELELMVRKWTVAEHKLYIVSGPVFKDNKGVIGKDKVLVPGYFFKIIYDPADGSKMISFLFPNEKSNRRLIDFAVTTDKIEQITGYDFFSQLPDDQETKLEGSVQLAGWFPEYTPVSPVASKSLAENAKSDKKFYLILVGIIGVVAVAVGIASRMRKR